MFSTGRLYLQDTLRWMATRTPDSQRVYHGLQWARKNLGDYFQHSSPQGKPTSLQKILSWTRGQFQEVLNWWQSVPWKKWISSSEPLSTQLDTANHQTVNLVEELRNGPHKQQAVKQSSKKAIPLSPEEEIRFKPKEEVKMNWREIFGSEPSKVVFEQQAGTSTCYVLSPLGAVLRHPQAMEFLQRIPVYQVQQEGKLGFQVHFPGPGNPVFVAGDELERGLGEVCGKHENLGIRLLERAYLKLKDARPFWKFDESAGALLRMFGEENTETISIQNSRDLSGLRLSEHDETKELREVTAEGGFTFFEEVARQPDHHIGEQTFFHEGREQAFGDYLKRVHAEKEDLKSMDILTAIVRDDIPDDGLSWSKNHYYAVLPHESYYVPNYHKPGMGEWMVTLANPFRFQADAFFTVPLNTFMTDFNIEGIRLARTQIAPNPFKTAP